MDRLSRRCLIACLVLTTACAGAFDFPEDDKDVVVAESFAGAAGASPGLGAGGAPEPGLANPDLPATKQTKPPRFSLPPLACDAAQARHQPRLLWRLTPSQYMNVLAAAWAGRGVLGQWKNAPPQGMESFLPFDGVNKADRFTNYAAVFTMSDRELWYVMEAAAELARQYSRTCDNRADFDVCTREELARLGEVLFGRPLAGEELDTYAAVVDDAVATLGTAEALKLGFQGLFGSPRFLFRSEIGQGQPIQEGLVRLSQYELASALSFRLTDMPPDNELYDLAKAGSLDAPEVIAQQIERLLNMQPSKWTVHPIARFMREYFHYDEVTAPFKEDIDFHKPLMLLEDADFWVLDLLFEHGRQNFLSTLLTSNTLSVRGYTAPYFGLELDRSVSTTLMDLPAAERMGLMTHPAFLIAYSGNDHTKPVQRGRFVRESLLCGVVPDLPGSEVPPLPDLGDSPTFRQVIEAHAQPACYGCHQYMDPLGLSFEAYDDLGRYRTTEYDKLVDTSGELKGAGEGLDGPITGVPDLVERLAGSSVVRQCFVLHAFSFLSGRDADESSDACHLLELDAAFGPSGGDFVGLLTAYFTSDYFMSRRVQ